LAMDSFFFLFNVRTLRDTRFARSSGRTEIDYTIYLF